MTNREFQWAAQELSASTLFAQPIVDLRGDGALVTGYELLFRPHHTKPNTNIEAIIRRSEFDGTVGILDRHIMNKAIAATQIIAQVLPAGEAPITFNVNISGNTLSDPRLLQSIEEYGTAQKDPRTRLLLELTETAAIHDTKSAERNLQAFRQAGFGIVLDDFPMGHNDLTRMLVHNDAIDGIKLDKSLLTMANITGDFAVMAGHVTMARQNFKVVIVEGIENAAVFAKLRTASDCAVDFGQGYHFGKPQSLDSLFAALQSATSPQGGNKPPNPTQVLAR